MNMLDWLAVLVGVCASVIDVKTRRIPNVLTLGAALLAFCLRGYEVGFLGVYWSVIGFAAGLLVLLPFFVVRGVGGGDVKLLAAFGAFVGAQTMFWGALFGMVIGGCFAVLLATQHKVWRRTMSNVGLMLIHWRVAGFGAVAGLTLEDSKSIRLPYGVPLTCGLIVALWLGK